MKVLIGALWHFAVNVGHGTRVWREKEIKSFIIPEHDKYMKIYAPWRTIKRGIQSFTSASSIGGGSPGSAVHLYIAKKVVGKLVLNLLGE